MLQGNATAMPSSDATFDKAYMLHVRLYVLRGQVNTRHATSITLHDESTCAPEPAAHIKNLVGRPKTELIEKTLRRYASTNVELVDRCQIVDPDAARCLAEFGNACQDRLEKAAMGIVGRD